VHSVSGRETSAHRKLPAERCGPSIVGNRPANRDDELRRRKERRPDTSVTRRDRRESRLAARFGVKAKVRDGIAVRAEPWSRKAEASLFVLINEDDADRRYPCSHSPSFVAKQRERRSHVLGLER